MCFIDFYTSIYNIRLGFLKIENKTSKEEVRAKPTKKTGSLRQSIPLPRWSRQGLEDGLGFT